MVYLCLIFRRRQPRKGQNGRRPPAASYKGWDRMTGIEPFLNSRPDVLALSQSEQTRTSYTILNQEKGLKFDHAVIFLSQDDQIQTSHSDQEFDHTRSRCDLLISGRQTEERGRPHFRPNLPGPR